MSRTSRIRIDARLRTALTSGHGSMSVGGTLSAGSAGLSGESVGLAAGASMLSAGASALSGGMPALSMAQQRATLAEVVCATLDRGDWTVTVVDASEPDGYVGIEATRGSEHLLAAVGADELITDQAGSHDCAATVESIVSGLREAGAAVSVTDDVPHDGSGGSLYAIAGAPSRAHAIAATLRRPGSPGKTAARRRSGPDQLRSTAGNG
jgi:hypothetical protein